MRRTEKTTIYKARRATLQQANEAAVQKQQWLSIEVPLLLRGICISPRAGCDSGVGKEALLLCHNEWYPGSITSTTACLPLLLGRRSQDVFGQTFSEECPVDALHIRPRHAYEKKETERTRTIATAYFLYSFQARKDCPSVHFPVFCLSTLKCESQGRS